MRLVFKRSFVFVIVLFLLINFIYAADYYVATTGSNITGDGSQGNPWLTIQYAINNVTAGDTIHVANGTYTENVDVNKSVNLVGDGYTNTTVTAASSGDSVFDVTANNVNISEFTVTGSTGTMKAGIRILASDYCNIFNNNASNNWHGITLFSSSNNNTLTNNTANSNSNYGISIYSSSNNTLTNNTANSNSNYGISLLTSSNNILTSNTMSDNTYNLHITGSNEVNYNNDITTTNLVQGKAVYYFYQQQNQTNDANIVGNIGMFWCIACNNVSVKNANLSANNYNGIYFRNTTNSFIENVNSSNSNYGIYIYSSSNNNTLTNNTANSNVLYGIYLESSSDNTLTNNIANLNTNYGIYLSYSSNNTLTNNTANSNVLYGIHITHSSNNNLTNNTANSNSNYGIYIYSSSNNNTLTSNTANSNSVGIYLDAYENTPTNNILSNNILSNNFNSIFDNDYSNNYSGNKFFSDNNVVFDPSINRSLISNQKVSFDVYVNYINQTACSNVTVNNITTSPSETISYSTIGNKVSINFTPSRQGLYSLVLNVTDDSNNTGVQRFYLGNQSTVKYYLRPDIEPTHGQPAEGDSKSLLFGAPTGESSFSCARWIQTSPDNISTSITGISRIININMSFCYKLSSSNTGFFGIERSSADGKSGYIEYGKYIPNSVNYIWNNEELDVSWWLYNKTDWYWLSLKLIGSNPYWYTNATQPSYVNFTYLYTDTPEIKNISNTDIQLFSATSPATNTNNATIILDGIGTTNLTVQMLNSALTYSAEYDGNNCADSTCSFTQNNGELTFNLVLGSEHNLTIFAEAEEETTSSGSSWKTRITKQTQIELEKEWRNINKDILYEWDIEDFKVIDTITFIPEQISSNAKININLLDRKPTGIERPENTYQYLNITPINLEVKQANITFKVNKTWRKNNPGKIVLSRYNNKWQDLETKYLRGDEDYKYYKATTPGFSYFAIRADENIQEEEIEEDIQEEEEVEETKPKSKLFLYLIIPLIIVIILFLLIKRKYSRN